MTVKEAIERTDAMRPNPVPLSEKINRLCSVDRTVMSEIVLRHEHAPDLSFDGYSEDSQDETLLVPPPYDELYIYALEALIYYACGELTRYNNSLATMQSIYESYRREYHRTHMPLRSDIRYLQ